MDISNAKMSLIIPSKPINITEEVNKTTIWKQVNDGAAKESNKLKQQKKNLSS